MTKIFIVTFNPETDYSDKVTIEKVFSTKSKANKYLKTDVASGCDNDMDYVEKNYSITEYDLL